MSFLSTISDIGSGVSSFFSKGSVASSLVKTVGLAYVASQIAQNSSPSNKIGNILTTVDAGQKIQLPPSLDNKIPVVYGTAMIGGNITEAKMSTDNLTMYYVVTICEKTGTLLSSGAASTFTMYEVYWNDQKIIFQPGGITASYTIDKNGVTDSSISGLVQVYCYAGNTLSTSQVIPSGYSTGTNYNAYSIIPGWDSTYTMSNLVFAVIKVSYSSAKNVTGIGSMKFKITNSMSLPGDCLYDYMSNSIYGAGLPTSTIYSV